MASATPGFQILFDNLAKVGFFEFFLPLILFLSIYYGLLQKTAAISEEVEVNGVASLALSFITVFGIYTFVPFEFFPQFFGVLSIILLGLLSVLLIMGMLGINFSVQQEGLPEGAQIIAIIAVVIILLVAVPYGASAVFGLDVGESYWNFLLTLAMIVVIAASIYFLTQDV